MNKYKYGSKTVSVRIPDYLHAELVKLSIRMDVSIVSLLETALKQFLETQKDMRNIM